VQLPGTACPEAGFLAQLIGDFLARRAGNDADAAGRGAETIKTAMKKGAAPGCALIVDQRL
jgi:hypothetical protein